MDKKKIFFTALVLTLMPSVTRAQENLIKAMDNFIADKNVSEYITTNIFSENPRGTKESQSYCYSHWFEMPVNFQKKIEPLRNAFYKDMDCAYNVMVKSAGSNSKEQMNIAYGDKLDKEVLFGSHSSHNYMVMLVRDKQDSLKRYCYAVTWYIDHEKNSFCGSLFKIYSKDPKQQRRNATLYNLGKYLDLENLTIGNDDNQSTARNDLDSIRTDIDFLQAFGNLSVAYRKNTPYQYSGGETLLIGLANKMLEICRKHKALLSKNEKELCIDRLKELQSWTSHKYLKGLLSESVSILKN